MKFKNMTNTQLEKARGVFHKLTRLGPTIAQPLAFFGMLAVAGAASYFFALPALLLFTVSGAALASITCSAAGKAGEKYIDKIKASRDPASQVVASAAARTQGSAPVSNLPDLSGEFGKGLDNAVKVRPSLRLKNSGQSAFLSS